MRWMKLLTGAGAAPGMLLLLGALSATTAFADAHQGRVTAELAAILADPEARAAAVEAGRDADILCQHCHGPGGNSVKPRIPNLASQNPLYMLQQFFNYESGERHDFTGVMQGLLADLSEQEKLSLIVYFSAQPLETKEVAMTPEEQERGARIYSSYCFKCHGDSGRGQDRYPRIAGQQAAYVAEVLKLFRDGSSIQARDRHSEVMAGIATILDDRDIDALAAYVANLY